MRPKTWTVVIGIFLLLALLTGAGSAGFVAGWMVAPKASQAQISSNSVGASADKPTDTDTLFKPFWEAWELVHDYYMVQPVDDVKLMQGAIRGMIEGLGDPHSSYMDPFEYEIATDSFSGEYEGIGAWVNTEGEYLTIAEPMPGSPAEKAGLLPGDQIIAIDGESMTGVDPLVARRKVLGPARTTVVLTILRDGVEEPFDVSITRASISVPSVTHEMLDGKIGYVKIIQFGDKTSDELKSALRDLLKQEPAGLILDLRNNPGGGLTTAIEVASQFLKGGVVLYEEYGDGSRKTHKVVPGGLATDIPLVVLVNQFSASASEVVAGAIQDAGRGTLVGVTTYGKGTVQNWIPLSDNQGAVRITIARWLTPNNREIQEQGLTPDVVVEMTTEDMQANLDPQLDKAVEILLEK